ncbi:hypothetical protein KCP76_06670 [Salmonella enterica subsp. enterica serovar Weltevreden]|nr:hypothetical protein KCP76_06670 [Salmonella enterica subsp. enterica serovar Weltevreden]
MATDLRASASPVLAAVLRKGIDDCGSHLSHRSRLASASKIKLRALGANIERVKGE